MPFIAAILVLFLFTPHAFSQPHSQQPWYSATISSDTLAVTCHKLWVPPDEGRLLSDPTPTTTCGEMCQALSSSHPKKYELQPQTGTSDNLSTITGCTIDGAKIQLSIADSGDSITIQDSVSIALPGNQPIIIDETIEIVTLQLKNGVWVLDSGSGGSGGSGTVIVPDGGRISFKEGFVQSSPTEGFFPPTANSCAGAIGVNQFCAELSSKTFRMGNGSVSEVWGGGGSGGASACAGATLDLD
jgi:hypothetical protein